MSALPQSPEEPENDAPAEAAIPSLRRVQGIANTALARTKGAAATTLNAEPRCLDQGRRAQA